MDPTTVFCPNLACPARGQTGQGNIGIHSRKDQRFLCTQCHKTFSRDERHGLLPPADTSRDRRARAHAPGARLPTASDRRGLWV